jgi:hypothetical protein
MSSYTDEEDEILCDGFKSLVITPDDDSTTCTLNETFSHSDASGHSCEVQSLWRCDICEEYRSYDYEDVVRHEETCTAFAIDRNRMMGVKMKLKTMQARKRVFTGPLT